MPGGPLRFSVDWLTVRESLDYAARSRVLAGMLVGRLPVRPRLIDLGAGTGSLFRFMAPLIGRSQNWIFADADVSLIGSALDRTADWARCSGFGARLTGNPRSPGLTMDTLHGAWHIQSLVVDLAKVPHSLPLHEVDVVVCSALLDLTSREWVRCLFAELRTPFYASLTVDGRDAWFPHHPIDGTVRLAFRRDQRRDKGLGLALGVKAAQIAEQLLASLGWEVFGASSDWRVPRSDRSVGQLLTRMTAQAAIRAMPAQASNIATWSAARVDQAARARLSIRIGHRDFIAFPPTP